MIMCKLYACFSYISLCGLGFVALLSRHLVLMIKRITQSRRYCSWKT